jgi:hypothetical protein
MSLTKEQRDALPSHDFAVPETRDIPIHDVQHTKMAWGVVDEIKKLTDEQKQDAKKKIILRAKKLQIDTSGWEIEKDSKENQNENIEMKFNSIHFDAMAIKFPYDETEKHPNKIPFSGILSRVDEPSDNPIGGSDGKRVILPKDVAASALSSLLGMAIDFTRDLDGHDAQSKIGFITEANIEGNAILIKGYFYGADFPQEVKRIQAEKSHLGFSYEAQVQLRSMNDDPLVIKSCIFTGAAVLYKQKAGYTTTALNANAEKDKMSDDILKALKEMNEKINSLQASVEKVEKKSMQAPGLIDQVKTHADTLRACADAMVASGIGTHSENGHAIAARKIADHLMAAASSGQLPHQYQTTKAIAAAGEEKEEGEKEDSKETKELRNLIASLQTKITDLEKQNFDAAGDNVSRKTVDTANLDEPNRRLLARAGITDFNKKVDVYELDAALKPLNLPAVKTIQLKSKLASLNMID